MGIVKDADTQEPLSDVIVFLERSYMCYFSFSPGGPPSDDLCSVEAVTNNNGKYCLPLDFSLMPPFIPFICIADEPIVYYFKIGYFTGRSGPSGEMKLSLMRHYLDCLPILQYKGKSFDGLEYKSKHIKELGIDKIKNIHPQPVDEIGVFFRIPNSKFMRIYNDKGTCLVYNELADEWIRVDNKGGIFEPEKKIKNPQLPKYESSITANDLPESKEDDSVRRSIFQYVLFNTKNMGSIAITKTPKMWHVYNIKTYNYVDAPARNAITELLTLPNENEITAIDLKKGDYSFGLFIALKNKGLKYFEINAEPDFKPKFENWILKVKEDTDFFKNASITKNLNIKSLAFCNGDLDVHAAVYAVTGEDKIYRFSEKGIPDFIMHPIAE